MSSPIARRSPGLIIFALSVGAFAIGTTEFAAMSLLPFFAADLGISEPVAGHVISAYALGVVVGAPVIAVLAARLSRRTLLISLMALFAVGNGLSGIAGNYQGLLVYRFISGLPHGAYFGIASLVVASMVPLDQRAQAISRMFLGLTIATIIGVPAANALGQLLGWRAGFLTVSVLAVATMTLVAIAAPHDRPSRHASPLRELGALRNPQVLLTLLSGAIGFGGLFAVYTYVASTLIEVTGVSEAYVPLVLGVFGVGMTVGNLAAGKAADRALERTAIAVFVWGAVSLALFPVMACNVWTLTLDMLLIGCAGGLGPVLQTRLMDVAGDAQALAAAAHHSAFNLANALGPWLAGLAIAAGYGFTASGWIGTALSLAGLAVFLAALGLERAGSRARSPAGGC
ncbi:MFS transporter [Novosphingobium sp. PC22D]|uniref:MFS transporter n=1 Tax=Novosphingobium sp. PC22D TaxID=1962403 RepID=UPI000BFAD9E4|nr:MFS transporter [Novosphingobium sp. PC22D]PEQ10854.1 MFS transporter [Novosphingobium sp. PC22D]